MSFPICEHELIAYEHGFFCIECGAHFNKNKKRMYHNPYDFKMCGLCGKERKGEKTIVKYMWAYFPVCKECYWKEKEAVKK
jgi:hypothetical protein